MLIRRACGLMALVGLTPLVLLGCPNGDFPDQRRQDGGAEASDALVGDGDTEAGEGGADAGDPRDDSGPPRGSGALCGANGRNDCGPFHLCMDTLGCVECKQDEDCPVASPRCLQGACVGCRLRGGAEDGGADAGMSDCPGAGAACWASDDECHPACSEQSACPAGTACDKSSGECLGCKTDSDCASGVCSQVLHTCVGCVEHSDCPSTHPRCRVLTGTCEACTANVDCGLAAPICDPKTFTCRVGCSTDAQCPGQRCDLAAATCVDIPVDAGLTDASAPDAH